MSPSGQLPAPGARILIVDDGEDSRELLKIILGREGFSCLTAGSGADALSVARSQAPDLVLLDLILPDMTGFEVARELTTGLATRHIPIIVVSGMSDSDTRLRAVEAGALELVTKPIDRRALSERIRAALSLKPVALNAERV